MRIGTALAVAGLSLVQALADGARAADKDWPAVGGDLANSHYSMLGQIDRSNIGSLGGAWVRRFDGEKSRATPVIVDGKMFVTAGAHLYVLKPDSGDIIWSHAFEVPPIGLFRGVAVGQGLVFVGLSDSRLVALDEKTGVEVWAVLLGDEKPANVATMGNQWVTGAPAYVNGMVIAGVSGGRAPSARNDGRVLCLDAKTGKVLWRFHVIPAPGEQGHDTWPADNDVWKRGGGPVWVTPAIDPELGLVYVGTGNAIPELGGEVRAGDNLYTASALALEIKTGKLRWYNQATHHDIWEQDLGTPLVLYDATVGGKRRKAIGVMRTDGYLFLLDRATGKPIHPVEERPVPQNARLRTASTQPFPVGAGEVGPRCVEDGMVPDGFTRGCYFDPIDVDTPGLITPVATTRSSPMAYDPEAQIFYVAGAAAPLWLQRWDDPFVFSSVGSAPFIKNHGILAAIDSRTDKIVWQKTVPYQSENGSGMTATAGGLLFHGDPGGELQAYDSRTGDLLWRFQTGANESGPPAVYEAGGTEYVAVIAGDTLWAFKRGGTLQPAAPPPPPPTETALRGRVEATDQIRIGAEFTDNRSLDVVRHYSDDNAFMPQKARVKAGSSVTWTNGGKLAQDVTALDGSWSTGEIAPGQARSVRFDRPGTFYFRCKDHPWSYGQIVVE